MSRRSAWCVLTVAIASGVATAQPPATTRSADADLTALLAKLGADEEVDRTAAQRQLVDLGTTAVDALTAAADQDADPEVRSRSAAALAEIHDRQANGPTLVTVHAHDADPRSVFAEVGRQAHGDLVASVPDLFTLGRGHVTVDADRKPFWDVMADVCGQAGVCPLLDAPSRGTVRLVTTDRSWIKSGPHNVVGPFWVGVAGLYRLSSVDLSGPPATDEQFLARLILFPEPKLVVTQVSPLTVREAVDDAGNSLVPAVTAGGVRALSRAAARLPARTVEARLQYPADHAGHRIVTLSGDLTVTLAQAARRFEADDVVAHPHVTRPLSGVHVRVGVTRSDPDVYLVTVECHRESLADPQWAAMVNRVNDVSVEDDAGRALVPLGWAADSGNSPVSFKATGSFSRSAVASLPMNRVPTNRTGTDAATVPPPPGEPRRVVWTVADRFKVVTVPVTFHDLPMP